MLVLNMQWYGYMHQQAMRLRCDTYGLVQLALHCLQLCWIVCPSDIVLQAEHGPADQKMLSHS